MPTQERRKSWIVQAREAGEKAVGSTGTCSVCGRVGQVIRNGRGMRPHNRRIVHRGADEHGPEVAVTVECRGSRRPPVEYREAFKAVMEVARA